MLIGPLRPFDSVRAGSDTEAENRRRGPAMQPCTLVSLPLAQEPKRNKTQAQERTEPPGAHPSHLASRAI